MVIATVVLGTSRPAFGTTRRAGTVVALYGQCFAKPDGSAGRLESATQYMSARLRMSRQLPTERYCQPTSVEASFRPIQL
jgi:hypothetical protein